MSYFTWIDTKIKDLHWYDISLIKLSTAALVLWIAKLWEPLLSLDTSIYFIIGMIAAIKPMLLIFKK